MNRVFALVWNASMGCWTVTHEHSKRCRKTTRRLGRLALPSLLLGATLTSPAYADCSLTSNLVVCNGIPSALTPNNYSSTLDDLYVHIQPGASVNTVDGGKALEFTGRNITLSNLGLIDPGLYGQPLNLSGGVFIGNGSASVVTVRNETNGILRGTGTSPGMTPLSSDGLALSVNTAQSGTTSITNDGLITSQSVSGDAVSQADTPVVAVFGGSQVDMVNNGTIEGQVAFASSPTGNTFSNAGNIIGGVSLGASGGNTFIAFTNSTISAGSGDRIGRELAAPSGANLSLAPAGKIDGGANGNNSLFLQNVGLDGGTAGSGTASSDNFVNFTKLTVNSGTWTLLGPLVSGSTTLNGGLALFNDSNAFGNGTLTANGGSLQASTSGLALDNAISLGISGLGVSGSNDLSLRNLLSGTGGLTKSGSGQLTLDTSNLYYGDTRLNGGTVQLGANQALGWGNILVSAASTMATAGDVSLNNSVYLGSNLTTAGTGNLALSGAINGTGALIKNGSGSLTLSGSNFYMGGTALNGGTLLLGNNLALGAGALNAASGTTLGATQAVALGNSINLAANLNISSDQAMALNGSINGAGGLLKNGNGSLTLAGANGYLGTTWLNAGSLILGSNLGLGLSTLRTAAGTTLDSNTSVTLNNAINLDGNLFIAGNAYMALSGAINGNGGLIKNGNAKLILNGSNGYLGSTILNGGTLALGNSQALSTGNLTVGGAATLDPTTSLFLSNNITLNDRLTLSGLSALTLAGQINGIGSLSKDGSANLTLTGDNTYSGGTTLNAGTLSVTTNRALGTGALDVNGNASLTNASALSLDNTIRLAGNLTTNTNYALTLNGQISGSAGLIKNGTAKLTLNGANNYSGATALNAGGLILGSDTALGRAALNTAAGTSLEASKALSLDNGINLGGNLTIGGSNALTLNGAIDGNGGLIKNSSADLTLNAVNQYMGNTSLNAGRLILGSNMPLGFGQLNVVGGTTLDASRAVSLSNQINLAGTLSLGGGADMALDGPIIGVGGLVKNGSANLTLNNSNSYLGNTYLNGGTLTLGHSNSLGLGTLNVGADSILTNNTSFQVGNNINLAANLKVDIASNMALAGSINGTGGLEKAGLGDLSLTGSNNLIGPLNILGGSVSALNSNALGAHSIAHIASGASLNIGGNANLGALSGAGTLQTVSGGTVTIGRSNLSTDFSGDLVGSGGLIKTGSGSLNLTGNNSLSGTTQVESGTLKVTGSLASSQVSVGNTATLKGGGTLSGVLTVNNGGHLALASGSTLTTGSLLLAANSNLDVALRAPSISTLMTVNGDLTLDGKLNVSNAGGFGVGVYRLMNYSGNLTDRGLDLAGAPAGFDPADLSVQTSVGNQVNLLVASPTSSIRFWDGSNQVANGLVEGGSGFWSASGSNWTNVDGTINQSWGNDFAVFQGAPGTVMVDGTQTFTGLQFLTDGYRLVNGTAGQLNALDGSGGDTAVRVDPNVTASIDVNITGSGPLNKLDSGTLVLNGQNSYTGNTLLSGGTLVAGSNSALGNAQLVAAGGTKLDSNAAHTIGNGIQLNGDLSVLGSHDLALSGNISGPGSLIKNGAANLTLSGSSAHLGGTLLNAGTLTVGSDTALGLGGLRVAGNAGLDSSRAVSLGNSVRLDANLAYAGSHDLTLNGELSGSGGLTKNGTGNLTLGRSNSFAGGTTLNGGTLTLGNAGALGFGGLNVGGASTLAINLGAPWIFGRDVRLDANLNLINQQDVIWAGLLDGSGTLSKQGAGDLTLVANNGFSGTFDLQGGSLSTLGINSLGNNASVQLGSGTVLKHAVMSSIASLTGTGNAQLSASSELKVGANNASSAFDGTVSGAGLLNKIGNGVLTLNGNSTHTGRTAINGGTLQVDGALASSSVDVNNAGTLSGHGSLGGAVTVADGGHLALSGGALSVGSLRLAEFANLDVGLGAPVAGGGSGLLNVGGNLVLDGTLNVRDAGGFGSGVYRLANYTGNLTDNGLQIGNIPSSVTAGDLQLQTSIGQQVNLLVSAPGVTLQFWDGAQTSSNGAIDGGNGTWGSGSNWTSADGSSNQSWADNFAVFQGAAGTVSVNGLQSFNGMQFVTDGYRLQNGTAGALNLVNGAQGNASVRVDPNATATLDVALIGNGALGKYDSGTLVLNGANSYSGGTRLNGGTLVLGNASALGSGSLAAADGTTLDNSAALALNNALALNGALTLAASHDLTLNGGISGNGSLIKQNATRLVLNGANSYSGGTRLNGGTLVLGNDSALGSGSLTAANGTTLETTTALNLGNALQLDGELTLTGSHDLTLGGDISGAGSLIKQGGSSLTLSGDNSFSGALNILGGNLTLSGTNALGNADLMIGSNAGVGVGGLTLLDALSGTGNLVLAAGSQLRVGASNASSSYDGLLSGTGNLSKIGTGKLVLNGQSTIGGGTSVEAGSLIIGAAAGSNASLTSNVQVASGALLGGHGSIIGNIDLARGALLNPGNSIGTLHVSGDVNLAAGSTLQIEANPDGTADKLIASGTVSLAGADLQVLAGAGSWQPSTHYDIIEAGALAGTFANVSSNLAFLTPELAYSATGVELTLERNQASFDSVARTANQRATAVAVETLATGSLYSAVSTLSAEQARAAYDNLSGEVHASTQGALFDDSRYLRDAIGQRLRAAQGRAPADGVLHSDADSGITFWVQGYGGWGDNSGNSNTARLDHNSQGTLLGIDLPAGDNWRLGIAAGYGTSNLDLDARQSSADIDSTSLTLYAAGQWDAINLRLGASRAWNDIDSSRHVQLADLAEHDKASYDASTTQVFGELGYAINAGDFTLEPFAGLARVKVDSDSFKEHGGATALRGDDEQDSLTYGTLGLHASTAYTSVGEVPLALQGTLGWQHAFEELDPERRMSFAGGSDFTVQGTPLARDTALAQLGVRAQVASGTTVDLGYSGQFGDGYKDNGVRLGLNVSF